jgi:hypothetical protein
LIKIVENKIMFCASLNHKAAGGENTIFIHSIDNCCYCVSYKFSPLS